MEMKGEYGVPLPRDAVWRALNDPEILKASLPGCEVLERESDTKFTARVAASVGPVKAKFSGEATLSDIDPPNGYTLTGSGSGGPAGMAKGSAKVRLEDSEGGATRLTYEVQAQIAGKLAQIGSRLVDMAAKKMADEFFGNFVKAATEAEAGAPAAAGPPIELAAAAPMPASAEPPSPVEPPAPTPPEPVPVSPAPVAAPTVPQPPPVPAAASAKGRHRIGWILAAAIAVIILILLTR